MYHPTTLQALAEARQSDLLSISAGMRRGSRSSGDRLSAGRLVAHPRLVTAAVMLLVAFAMVAL